MLNFKNTTLQLQMRLMIAVTLLGMLTVILFAMFNLNQLRKEFAAHQSLQTMDKSLVEIKASALAISRADPILGSTQQRLAQTDGTIRELLQRVLALTNDVASRDKFTLLEKYWQAYVHGMEGAVKIASSSPADALQIPDVMFSMQLQPMVDVLDGLVAANQMMENSSQQKISSRVSNILWVVLLPLVLAGIVVTVFQTMFSHSLRQRLQAIAHEVKHLHQGDLSRRLPVSNKDEISQLSATINGFIASFEHILRDVHSSADQTQKTAHGVTDMAKSVSTNAKKQSDRVFEVSSAMEQMGNTIREIASNAASAAHAARESLAQVKAGSATGQHTIAAMGKIDVAVSSSVLTMDELGTAIQRISAVSNMIKDIAEQTNLLALNAAIEAARAGEHGRGFAVVADEVRKLSERTAVSTQDIARIVQVIQSGTVQSKEALIIAKAEAMHGVRHGESMGQLLQQIEKSVHIVTDMMGQIAAATEEQSAAGDHIAQNIDTVVTISASTAHDIEHARNAMMHLAEISKTLFSAVGQFKLAHAV